MADIPLTQHWLSLALLRKTDDIIVLLPVSGELALHLQEMGLDLLLTPSLPPTPIVSTQIISLEQKVAFRALSIYSESGAEHF